MARKVEIGTRGELHAVVPNFNQRPSLMIFIDLAWRSLVSMADSRLVLNPAQSREISSCGEAGVASGS